MCFYKIINNNLKLFMRNKYLLVYLILLSYLTEKRLNSNIL